VRGPANYLKDAVYPLEGVVETDWSAASFTMNWKFTRKLLPVRFEVDEPICMIVPQRRGELESFAPELRHIDSDEKLRRNHDVFLRSRDELGQVWPRRTPTQHRGCRGKVTTPAAPTPTVRRGRRITRLAAASVRSSIVGMRGSSQEQRPVRAGVCALHHARLPAEPAAGSVPGVKIVIRALEQPRRHPTFANDRRNEFFR
jgi:hypothetical protein